ncbi:hypothetical protein LCGC14_0459200 [marine sediment metagenome]|uniref:Uncharacterized protein n=1 Tax=marine sediment metagenome TaxID=412755 RepID=A0A0F9V2C0_9ZZZZ
MIVDNLSKEVIKRIFADIGAVPGKLFGRVGLVDPALRLAKTITVRYDDMDRRHDVYAGQMPIKSSTLRGLFVNLTVEDDHEYLFIFRMDELPIHALRAVYDADGDDDFFRIFEEEKGIWREANMYMKARLLADFERMVSWGLLWEDCEDVKDLYTVATELIR